MGKSGRQKKDRRKWRKSAAHSERAANRIEQKVGGCEEAASAMKSYAEVARKLGSIRGRKELKSKQTKQQ